MTMTIWRRKLPSLIAALLLTIPLQASADATVPVVQDTATEPQAIVLVVGTTGAPDEPIMTLAFGATTALNDTPSSQAAAAPDQEEGLAALQIHMAVVEQPATYTPTPDATFTNMRAANLGLPQAAQGGQAESPIAFELVVLAVDSNYVKALQTALDQKIPGEGSATAEGVSHEGTFVTARQSDATLGDQEEAVGEAPSAAVKVAAVGTGAVAPASS